MTADKTVDMTTDVQRDAVQRLRDAVTVRRAWLATGFGAAVGLDIAALWQLRHLWITSPGPHALSWLAHVGSALGYAVLFVVAGALTGYGLFRMRRTSATANADLEQLVPHSRNLLFTALEAEDTRSDKPSVMRYHIAQSAMWYRATQLAASIDVPALLPWTGARRALVTAGVLWLMATVVSIAIPSGAVDRGLRRAVAGVTGTRAISRIDVTVTPPAYTGRSAQDVREPTQIEALEGSTLMFVVASTADTLHVTTDSGEVKIARPGRGDFRWHTTVRHDGFAAFATTSEGEPRLIAITRQSDAPPGVRITSPARDLVVDSTRHTLAVAVEAGDDIGLRSLSLHYTKVSGSGERFTFSEGQVPVRITRSSGTAWHATATLPLDSLLTEPGDLVVYRARAADARPGADATESDAFIAERAAAGGIAAAGFALDPDEDRYAVSQQMVILKTERLIASRKDLTPPQIAEQSLQLATEQRRVRAEFVFMTGGEFEQAVVADEEGVADLDETHEAESEADLAAGRMVNRGRTALLTAIRAMGRASLALGEQDLTTALRHERTALTNLQEAFARQRFLMRALTQREQLDFTRRLTGPLDSIARGLRATPAGNIDTQRVELRRVLDALVARAHPASPTASPTAPPTASPSTSPDRPPTLSALALRVLQLAPGDARAQRVATWLQSAGKGGETGSNPSGDARAALDSASLTLSTWLGTLTPGSDAGVGERASDIHVLRQQLQSEAKVRGGRVNPR